MANNIYKDIDTHGSIIASVEWWLNDGRYDDQKVAWGRRLELYRDGTVYMRKTMFHMDHGRAFLRRQKYETLEMMRKDYASWKDFRDAWLIMQKNLNRVEVSVEQAKKDK